MASDADGASGRQGWDEFRRIVRTLRLRLEDEARFGRVAVPRPLRTQKERRAPPEAGDGTAVRAPCGSTGLPQNGADSGAPEARAADAMREELSMAAAPHEEGQDLFNFGSPDLEGGASKEEALARIAAEVADCTRCPELVANRTHTVPGQGDPGARLVFVGEGPGADEDRQGLAFVGRAGQLLTKMIQSIDLMRDQVFICNIIKCRPPGNRNPTPEEIANCLPFLMRQLEIIRPKVICALGGVAAQTLLQTHDGITRLRGRFHPYRGAKLMPTFHSAYVLRNYIPDTRRKVYDDLLAIKAELDR